jgi:hypothetical protein
MKENSEVFVALFGSGFVIASSEKWRPKEFRGSPPGFDRPPESGAHVPQPVDGSYQQGLA